VTSSSKKTTSTKPKRRKLLAKRNYARGAATERFLVHDLIRRGAHLVMKGGGSKSYSPKQPNPPKVDLVALFGSEVVLVQSKPRSGSIPKAQRSALVKLAERTVACAFEGYREKGAQYDLIYCCHGEFYGWPPERSSCPVLEE
jgi:Holliday junction resolvase